MTETTRLAGSEPEGARLPASDLTSARDRLDPSGENVSSAALRSLAMVSYWSLACIVALVILAPIFALVVTSLRDGDAWSLANWAAVLHGDVKATIVNTLVIGFVCASGSTIVGALLAWLLVRTDVDGARLCTSLVLASLALPGFIIAMAYIIIGSRGGMINAALHGLFGKSAPAFDIYSGGDWRSFSLSI